MDPWFVRQQQTPELVKVSHPIANWQEDKVVFSDWGSKPQTQLKRAEGLQICGKRHPIVDFIFATQCDVSRNQPSLNRVMSKPLRLQVRRIEVKTGLATIHESCPAFE